MALPFYHSKFVRMNKDELNRIGAAILDAAIQVHRALGPGLLETAYRKALKAVLEKKGFYVREEVGVN